MVRARLPALIINDVNVVDTLLSVFWAYVASGTLIKCTVHYIQEAARWSKALGEYGMDNGLNYLYLLLTWSSEVYITIQPQIPDSYVLPFITLSMFSTWCSILIYLFLPRKIKMNLKVEDSFFIFSCTRWNEVLTLNAYGIYEKIWSEVIILKLWLIF